MNSLSEIHSINEKAAKKAEKAHNARVAPLLARCKTYDAKGHSAAWRNLIATELNEVVGRVKYSLDRGDDSDIAFATAALSLGERVANVGDIQIVKPKRIRKR